MGPAHENPLRGNSEADRSITLGEALKEVKERQ
jgi:hypothetical protein